jgi:hypothetical protein
MPRYEKQAVNAGAIDRPPGNLTQNLGQDGGRQRQGPGPFLSMSMRTAERERRQLQDATPLAGLTTNSVDQKGIRSSGQVWAMLLGRPNREDGKCATFGRD